MRDGDYVIGLEPSNSSVYGRKHHEEQGTMHTMAPFSSETFHLSFEILSNEEEIKRAQLERDELLKNEEANYNETFRN